LETLLVDGMGGHQSEIVGGADVVLVGGRFEGLWVIVVVVASAGMAARLAYASQRTLPGTLPFLFANFEKKNVKTRPGLVLGLQPDF
jgi:hypothetical protein